MVLLQVIFILLGLKSSYRKLTTNISRQGLQNTISDPTYPLEVHWMLGLGLMGLECRCCNLIRILSDNTKENFILDPESYMQVMEIG